MRACEVAPEKPEEGAPCNGCGFCCAAEPCGLAVESHPHIPQTKERFCDLWDLSDGGSVPRFIAKGIQGMRLTYRRTGFWAHV